MTGQTRIRLIALAVIAFGGLGSGGIAAQEMQEEGFTTCFGVGECPTNSANATCNAIAGVATGWTGWCVASGPFAAPCAAPTPERLWCAPPVVLPPE